MMHVPNTPGKPLHEETDISIQQVLIWAGVLAGTIVVSMFLMWILFGVFMKLSDKPLEPRRSARPGSAQSSSAPRLQSKPAQDLKAYRASENKTLSSYAWVDRQNGVVRIPIERAMQAVAASNLPVRTAPKSAPAPVAVAPTPAEATAPVLEGGAS